MNILLAPTHYMLDGVSGGSEYGWAYHIVESLSSYTDVRLFVLTGIVKGDKDFRPNVTVVRLDHGQVLNLTSAYSLAFIARYYLAARRVLRQHHIDIIHHVLPFGYSYTFNPLPLLGHTRAIPFVVGPLQMPHTVASTEEKIYSQGNVQPREGIAHLLQEKAGIVLLQRGRSVLGYLSTRTLRSANYLIAVNEQARQLYASVAPRIPSVVIPPGVDGTRFSRGVSARQGGINVEILCVGWLIRRKGIDVVIDAVAHLVSQFPSLRLRIVGTGPQRVALEDLARRQGIAEHVFFEGAVANVAVADYYARADIFVSMSYSESFGQTVVEAMLAELPVVSAENVGSREIIEDGTTGFLVQAGNTEELIARLQILIANPRLRLEFGNQARQVAVRRYNWNTISQQYLDVYQQVLHKGSV